MNWFATRDDDYMPPIVRGMRRYKKKDHARSRILSDDEIRKLWKLAPEHGTFGAVIQIALLTAQRREKICSMQWGNLKDGVWTVPTETREKGSIGAVALPRLALEIINAQPILGENPYVFAGRGAGHFDSMSKPKQRLDAQLKIPPWRFHDLRRTARSLLSRAGVSSEHAERVMGHVLPGVEGTYDRHRYDAEKKIALEKLAVLIDGIVNPRENVTPLRKRAKRT